MIDRLSNGDITKHEEVFQVKYVWAMTNLLFWKDKDEYIDKINKAREQEQKLKYNR
jgi:hypothetical protein